jgi:hypothetical protein
VRTQPAPQAPNSESVRIEYGKPVGQPNTAYMLTSITYFSDKSLVVGKLYNNNTAATITEISNGSFASTFTSTDFGNPAHAITAGTFTDVQR